MPSRVQLSIEVIVGISISMVTLRLFVCLFVYMLSLFVSFSEL